MSDLKHLFGKPLDFNDLREILGEAQMVQLSDLT